jgi:hypothetical protein
MCKLETVALAGLIILLSIPHCNAEGALALGKNGTFSWYGISWNASTLNAARAGALQNCAARGQNCSITETFRMGCLAIVFGRRQDGASWYNWFVRPIGATAQNLALTACRNHGGNCELKGMYCDSVDEAALAAQQATAAAEQLRQQQLARAELQRAQAAAREAEQRRIAAEQAAAAAETARRAAENATRAAEERITPNNGSIFNKPLSQSWPLGLFLLILFAAIKEIWSAKVPKQYKLVVTVAIATFEWGLFAFTGVNPGDPQILPIVSVNLPVVGVAVGFGFFAKVAHA